MVVQLGLQLGVMLDCWWASQSVELRGGQRAGATVDRMVERMVQLWDGH